jgi:hypothetical protein
MLLFVPFLMFFKVVLCPASAKLGEPLHFQSQAQTIADQRLSLAIVAMFV